DPDIRGALAAGSGRNLIGTDPGFVRNPSPSGTDRGDLRLTELSPAVDMGDDGAVPEELVADLDGNPRVVGASVDIGAYEFQGETPTGREAPAIVVTTLDDAFDPYDGQTSLREALFHAGHDGLDTAVEFDSSLSSGTITLDGQSLYVDHVATVDASAIGSLVIDGDGRSRVLTVLSTEPVELAALTVTGGAEQSGAGIASFGSLGLTGVSIVGNVATSSGGGLYALATLAVVNSTIAGNAVTGTSGSGGGVYLAIETAVLTNSIVAVNAAPGDPDIRGTLATGSGHNLLGVDPGFVRNPGPGDDGQWGTADDDRGDLRLTEFSPAIDMGDSDAVPAALAADLDGNPRVVGARVDIGVYEFQSEMAPGRETPSVVVTTLADTFDFYDGQTSLREALFHAGQNVAETNVTFDASLAEGTITLDGLSLVIDHALRIDASALGELTLDADGRSRVLTVCSAEPVELIGLTITDGAALNGGGVANHGTLAILDSTIVGNTATGSSGYGGGVYNSGELTIADSIISDNTATGTYGRGGGIANYSGTVTVAGSTVSGNAATGTSSDGGGIYQSSGTLTVTCSTVSGNAATGTSADGGGIYQSSGTLTVMGSTVFGNTARSGSGIYNSYGALNVANSTVSGNTATVSGGGIYNGSSSDSMFVVNSIISGNTAATSGGGVYNDSSTSNTLSVANSVISDNVAGSGGGFYNRYGAAILTNTTIAGNRTTGSAGGGGIYIYNGTVTATNSIVALNTASSSPNVLGSLAAESSHNLVGGDPGFVRDPGPGDDGVWGTADDVAGNFRLRIGSPAVNAGSNALAVDAQGNPLTTDLDGKPRIIYATVDRGAYEFRLMADANYDGKVDVDDSKILAGNWGKSGMDWTDGDYNGDGRVNAIDAAVLAAHWGMRAFPLIPGDANDNGVVDSADAKILAGNWGKSGMTWADGDFNDDGLVNAIDAAILAAHFGMTLPTPTEATSEVQRDAATVLVGPLPVGDPVAARERIAPAARARVEQDAFAPMPTMFAGGFLMERGVEPGGDDRVEQGTYVPRSPGGVGAVDAALAESAGLLNRRADWIGVLARRHARGGEESVRDGVCLAADRLLAQW
ncbi:MAG TPA: hypothetical protein DD670_03320, partial [Planctomycetaceae bacterium]|nr:hypothetical protein [Planctomycetaceae bacterium]